MKQASRLVSESKIKATVLETIEALGTSWSITLVNIGRTDEKAGQIHHEVGLELDRIENTFSRFLKTSDIGTLNQNGYLERPSQELLKLIKFGVFFETITHSIFTLNAGSVLSSHGYGPKYKSGNIKDNIIDATPTIMSIDSSHITLHEGKTVDIGAYGKGWAIDRLAGILKKHGAVGIINGGGDIYVHNDCDQTIYLEDPFNAQHAFGYVTISNQAIASSAANKRTWTFDGANHHHLVNQRQTNVIATHVIAQSCVLADALATALWLDPRLYTILNEHVDFDVIFVEQASPNSKKLRWTSSSKLDYFHQLT